MDKKVNLIEFMNEINRNLTTAYDGMKATELSELHVHKILFIQYGMFYKEFQKELFKPNFQAWKYGPVEIDYRRYIDNKDKLDNFFTTQLNENQIKFLTKITEKLVKTSPWYLVDITHGFDCWLNNYHENSTNNHNRIEPTAIQEDFKKFRM